MWSLSSMRIGTAGLMRMWSWFFAAPTPTGLTGAKETAFILCGISRLGFFNINATSDEPVKYYSGLPVTTTAIIYPLLGLFRGRIDENLFQTIYICATFLTAFLFVFKFKVPKFKGWFYIIVPILSLIGIILLLVIR